MTSEIGQAMDTYEIEEFLHERGLGVVSLAADGRAYAVPMAFAYDEEDERCFLRFVMGEDSQKRAFVAETEVATLAVYEWGGQFDWRSVVVRGPVDPLPESDLAEAAARFSELGEEGALEVFNRPISEYETGWYELIAEEVTGRGQYR